MASDVGLAAAAAGQLSRAIAHVLATTSRFNKVLKRLKDTVEGNGENIRQICQMRDSSGLPNDRIHRLLDLLQQPEKIVNKCSAVSSWNISKKYRYSNMLFEIDESIRSFFIVDVALMMSEDIIRINQKVDQLMVNQTVRKLSRFKQLKKKISNGSRINISKAASKLKKFAKRVFDKV